jgi:hypothetical protein
MPRISDNSFWLQNALVESGQEEGTFVYTRVFFEFIFKSRLCATGEHDPHMIEATDEELDEEAKAMLAELDASQV